MNNDIVDAVNKGVKDLNNDDIRIIGGDEYTTNINRDKTAPVLDVIEPEPYYNISYTFADSDNSLFSTPYLSVYKQEP